MSERNIVVRCARGIASAQEGEELIKYERELRAERDRFKRELEQTLELCENALEHIKDDLQPAFQLFAETGKLPYPWNDEYNAEQAAWRLATWWHGVDDDETVARTRAVLASPPADPTRTPDAS